MCVTFNRLVSDCVIYLSERFFPLFISSFSGVEKDAGETVRNRGMRKNVYNP
jgi:hypothetical protein